MKRCYFVYEKDELDGIGVVATTAKEAKSIAYASGEIDCDWIDMRVRWERDAEVVILPTGIVLDMREGLLHGIYGYAEGYKCEECGADTVLRACNGKALCDECIEKEYAKEEIKRNEGKEK